MTTFFYYFICAISVIANIDSKSLTIEDVTIKE